MRAGKLARLSEPVVSSSPCQTSVPQMASGSVFDALAMWFSPGSDLASNKIQPF